MTPSHVLVWMLAAATAATACHEARGMTEPAAVLPLRARPDGCRQVEPGGAVQAALDDPAVAAVCLAPGVHQGPFRLGRALTLWGPPTALIRAPSGTIIELAAPSAAVYGVTLDGTGGRFDQLDGAVRLSADDTRVEGVTVINAMFGILVERASRVAVVGNRIEGSRDPATGLRGDTIRLWETRDSTISGNQIVDGRDLVIWYSNNNTIANNRVDGARYGLHFMYSHDNRVTGNHLLRGVVGIFVMYSRGLELSDNLIAEAAGAAGMAIGIKDSGNIEIKGNRLIHDTIGIYVDSSPMQRGDTVAIERNVLRLNDTAVVFHSSARNIVLHDNDFADNQTQVRVDGGGDATAVEWRGNYFDDYDGYDLDDDGVGDVAYELRSLSNLLTAQQPNLALFRGTLALAMVDAAAHLDPLYQPRPVLVDHAPRMELR